MNKFYIMLIPLTYIVNKTVKMLMALYIFNSIERHYMCNTIKMSLQQEFLAIIGPYTCFSTTIAQTGPLCDLMIILHGIYDI